MQIVSNLELILLFISLGLILMSGRRVRLSLKKRRHQRNVSTGENVLLKLNSFSGVYKNQQILTYLRQINPYVFEELILSALIAKGFDIVRNKSYSGDGGMDGMFMYNGKAYLVQAKRYSNQVKTSHIHDFATLVKIKGAAGGYFIHTGRTAANSYEGFKSSSVSIISGQKLVDLILNLPVNKIVATRTFNAQSSTQSLT